MTGGPFQEDVSGLRAQMRDAPSHVRALSDETAPLPRAYGRLMTGAAALGALSIGFGFVLPAVVGAGEVGPSVAQIPAPSAQLQPATQPQPPASAAGAATAGETACPIKLPAAGVTVVGKALGVVPPEIAEPSVARAEAFVHGKVSPEYQGKPREFVSFHAGKMSGVLYAVIPAGMAVKSGDTVKVLMRHRDLNYPCSFVPFLLTGIVPGKG